MVLSSCVDALNTFSEMRVAVFSGAIPSTTFIENLIVGLADKGIEVVLYGTKRANMHYSGSVSKRYFYNGRLGSVLFFSMDFLSLAVSHPKRLLRYLRHLSNNRNKYNRDDIFKHLRVLRQLPDIFHVQWSKDVGKWSFLKQFDIKLIVSFRGAQINYSPICNLRLAEEYKAHLPLYDAYHCVSHAISREGEKYGATPDKCRIIYPAVNELLTKAKIKHTDAPSMLNILSVGRDHWKKGYRVAIDAMWLLKKEGIKFHYTIIAGGKKEELIYQINQLGLNDEVTLIDNLPHDEVLQQYNDADIFLLPSFEEGVANVALESMALGTFVISTNCGGMEEVIADGKNGFIVPIRDNEAIKEAIMRYLSTPENKKTEMIGNARNTIVERHLIDNQVDQMIKLYKEVLQ